MRSLLRSEKTSRVTKKRISNWSKKTGRRLNVSKNNLSNSGTKFLQKDLARRIWVILEARFRKSERIQECSNSATITINLARPRLLIRGNEDRHRTIGIHNKTKQSRHLPRRLCPRRGSHSIHHPSLNQKSSQFLFTTNPRPKNRPRSRDKSVPKTWWTMPTRRSQPRAPRTAFHIPNLAKSLPKHMLNPVHSSECSNNKCKPYK